MRSNDSILHSLSVACLVNDWCKTSCFTSRDKFGSMCRTLYFNGGDTVVYSTTPFDTWGMFLFLQLLSSLMQCGLNIGGLGEEAKLFYHEFLRQSMVDVADN